MQNVTAYRAEMNYRREQIVRDFRPARARRVVRAAARKLAGQHTDAA